MPGDEKPVVSPLPAVKVTSRKGIETQLENLDKG
jgi:hypothetical protein